MSDIPAILSVQSHMQLPRNDELIDTMPCPSTTAMSIERTRGEIARIVNGEDDRLLVVVGPCSIHDPDAALDYAQRLSEIKAQFENTLCLVMRTYFEKPRTTVGWKGFIYDPKLDGSADMRTGLIKSRDLLLNINALGLGTATEFLCPLNALYIADLISWGAIGARTTESQTHRELASALPCPIGFKNSTDGNIQIAMNAIKAAQSEQIFCTTIRNGKFEAVQSTGNQNCHLILRGGRQPNYYSADIEQSVVLLKSVSLTTNIMVDCSHGNSQKIHSNQVVVAGSLCEQISSGQQNISAVMLESYLEAGSQKISSTGNMVYGQSVTDSCIGWDDTCQTLDMLSEAVVRRRNLSTTSHTLPIELSRSAV
ncbi:3-deoxy-7-phosphoheptulonate synthase [Microbulbifer sp. OS29]|uniref:Phospho-2-dehydro-3-deoxyheptonate aldolase n=1 Tax=Microbulbifer okhotskensis TaxID=2926617 RepID=A0A9X2EMW7_9GAMM|nr:3-deoxy-7-phosphoheptulonate synthase [Microbulbifer okhotskensis]MCO1334525.1 3-deoxy-7-phosphoheptulonate synthase [Microbulbifer okhotskensis]